MTPGDEPPTALPSLALDHVHVAVADREASAEWYGRVLGLVRDARLPHWATAPDQPLFIGSATSHSCLALFRRRPSDPPRSGDHTIGLRVTAKDFLTFVARLETLALTGRDGGPLTAASAIDHGAAFSLHFLDPDGNHVELTTYDRDAVAAALALPAAARSGTAPGRGDEAGEGSPPPETG